MSDILAENLSGKAVMGSDGAELGMLYNITMDVKTGRLSNLIVDPEDRDPSISVNFETDEMGRFLVSVDRVQAVKDYIVVEH
ncbi:MAG: PRC-barrel domain-containing protein [Halobacteriales archaeon]